MASDMQGLGQSGRPFNRSEQALLRAVLCGMGKKLKDNILIDGGWRYAIESEKTFCDLVVDGRALCNSFDGDWRELEMQQRNRLLIQFADEAVAWFLLLGVNDITPEDLLL